MVNIIKNQKGMNIVGQGGKIILFTLPSLIAAILLDTYVHRIAALPGSIHFVKPAGYVLLVAGIILWGTAIVQLLTGFPRGKLITNGAYSIARNPIYSSATFIILPGVALLTLTWVYFIVSVFLYTGVMIFIRKEEQELTEAFGTAYVEYMAKVARLIPFVKPGRA